MKTACFIDGGVTPFNNPSLALFQMATFKPFGICWPTGPEHLTVTSSAPAPSAALLLCGGRRWRFPSSPITP